MNNNDENSIDNNKNNFISRLKNIKNLKLLLVILLLAILLFSVDYFTKQKQKPVTMTNEELRIASIINKIEGIDECEVYINYSNNQSIFDSSNEIEGVLVVIRGNKKTINKFQILNALQKALNINKDIIEILIL